ncbi:MAG: imidazolonepropionase, partial [Proteobacteria bacterium]|nr:imidazolonepropionase [Pseudomonadota bacterium]
MKHLLALGAVLIALAAPAAAQDFAIVNATVATGDGSEPIEHATVLVRGGKIAAAGSDVGYAPGIPVIDGTGKWVTPGLFATLTDLGLYDVDAVTQSRDISANNSQFNAALDIAPVINPLAQQIKISR